MFINYMRFELIENIRLFPIFDSGFQFISMNFDVLKPAIRLLRTFRKFITQKSKKSCQNQTEFEL